MRNLFKLSTLKNAVVGGGLMAVAAVASATTGDNLGGALDKPVDAVTKLVDGMGYLAIIVATASAGFVIYKYLTGNEQGRVLSNALTVVVPAGLILGVKELVGALLGTGLLL